MMRIPGMTWLQQEALDRLTLPQHRVQHHRLDERLRRGCQGYACSSKPQKVRYHMLTPQVFQYQASWQYEPANRHQEHAAHTQHKPCKPQICSYLQVCPPETDEVVMRRLAREVALLRQRGDEVAAVLLAQQLEQRLAAQAAQAARSQSRRQAHEHHRGCTADQLMHPLQTSTHKCSSPADACKSATQHMIENQKPAQEHDSRQRHFHLDPRTSKSEKRRLTSMPSARRDGRLLSVRTRYCT